MRLIYRGLAAAVVLAVAVFLVLPSGPDEDKAAPVAAPSAMPTSSATAAGGAVAVPATSPAPSPPPSPAPRPTPTPGASLAPGYTAMEAFYADSRIAKLPSRLSMKAVRPYKATLKDRESGLVVPALAKPWKKYGSGPYTSRQVIRGTTAAMLVTAPVPIQVQKEMRDTALLAARWTLSRHPRGAAITRWIASKPMPKGWMLVYQVKYGKRTALDAVVVMDGGSYKPGLAFVTVPDTRKAQWGQVARIAAGVRGLG
ncbi:hypothetical protein HNR30_008253 [Nonomuraea soli]|uniref:Uncharacterized protein n=2 Tax=Nonomuraea soli TaxID=1032476 RepID=A0A7W0CTC5_9ACTN|nr:hypothetical protein [Nonomuraea soli]